TGHSGFSPPTLQRRPHQEQITHTSQHEMADETLVSSAFVMIQPQFRLLVLKAPLDAMPRQSHPQERFRGGCLGGVRQEKLQLSLAEHLARPDQMPRRPVNSLPRSRPTLDGVCF